MIHKYIRRYDRWQSDIPFMSPFVIACGIIAMIYFFYRIALIISPAVMIERAAFSPVGGGNIVCSDDESDRLQDPQPILSAAYQKRIHDQRAVKPNVVTNPDLSRTNPETSQPIGYSRTVEGKNTKYSVLRDGNKKFLRLVTKKDSYQNKISPAWQIDPVTVQKDKAYAYSFWYRSGVPVDVSIEYLVHDKPVYSKVTTLGATRSWQQFAAHFNNNQEASSLRISISPTAAGWVDTRTFDIHQIPDAQLDGGLATVAFDDGWQSVDDKAFGLLDKYGIRSTQYIISDIARQRVSGYMNFDTIKKFKQAGHEIGSHSLRHCNQTTLSQEDLNRGAADSKQTLEQQDIGPITSFAYPLGQYDSKTQAVYEKHFPLIRTSDFGYNDRYFDATNIRSISVTNTTSDKEFKSWVDYAKQHRVWVVFVYHQVDTKGKYSATSAQLDRQLQIIAKSGLKTLPLSEAAASIRK